MVPAPASKKKRGASRVPVINGLRGLAIGGVLFNHILAGMFTPAELALPLLGTQVSLSPLVTNGWTGVNLFFILSGFVLFLPYAADERAMRGLDDRLAFYWRRARRLLPLFYVAAIAEWILARQRGMPAPLEELMSVLSLSFFLTPQYFGPSFNVSLWSIGVEMAFSATFPLLVLGMRRLGTARFAALVLGLALVARVVGILHFPSPHGVTFNSDTFVCRLDEFVLGMVLARFYAESRLPRRAGGCVIIGTALVVLAWFGFDLALRGVLPPIARALLNDVLDAGLFTIVLASLGPASCLAVVLCWRPLQVAGMMCYSLYVWHWPLLDWLIPDRAAVPIGGLAIAIPTFLALTFGVAALSYRFIEFRREVDWRSLFLLGASARQS
jgi:peptidoglycan/LPS O-acetylase OafA/YrhL